MRFTLKDYQIDAVADVLTNLRDARDDYRHKGRRTAFSLTATTGAGKTVMAAAVIEAVFGGDDAFDFPPDQSATVLWFSDDPSLNEQTRFRLLETTDRIPHSRLVVVSNTFNKETFDPATVYFLNTSKLSKNSLLVRGHVDDGQEEFPGMDPTSRPDMRTYTIWDTIRNSIDDDNRTLYMILDEAHRGMKTKTKAAIEEKATIVTRLINGHGDIPAMPIVWGISATVSRFNTAMANAAGRTMLPAVTVDSGRVQASGLLKDDILLDIPAESGTFDTVLLKRATRKITVSTKAWEKYATDQGDEPVIPLMVLQAPNTPAPAMLAKALDTIYEEWPELPYDAVAHVFGEHTTQQFGPYQVAYIRPERVQEARHVRVLIAKDAISTGWDCPRAEVLISFRPAKDETHITQLLGRMVRTPLARRIPGNDRLNSVECLLPFFDRKTATSVANILMNTSDGNGAEGSGGTGGGDGRRVLINPRDMKPNKTMPQSVWECFAFLPTQSLPRRGAKPVRRLTALAHALASDGLRPNAGKEAHSELHAVLDGLATRYGEKIAQAIKDVEVVEGETVKGGLRTKEVVYSPFAEDADDRVINDAYRAAGRVLSPDLSRTYADHIAGAESEEGDDGLRDAHIQIAALGLVAEVKTDLDREADKIAIKWLSQYRVAIKGLSDERQAVYNDLQAQSPDPQQISLASPKVRTEETVGTDNAPFPTRPKHLLSDDDGQFPVGNLNKWELNVLDSELGQPRIAAWYRNPARASQDSLAVAYRTGKDVWKAMRPDFVFFTESADGIVKASIVDPHGTHLADCLPKLRGLAEYAATYSKAFHRIEAVAKLQGGALRVLDLTKKAVRDAIADASDAEALYASIHASDY